MPPPHIRPRQTVDTALVLSDAGVLDAQTAQVCGVAVKTVRRWRRLYQRRGEPRRAPAPCVWCEGGELDVSAYTYLLGLYLGDGHLVLGPRAVWRLSIVQDARYPGLVEECRTLMTVVKPGAHPHLRAKPGSVAVEAYSKHWLCLFPQHGPGVKHDRPIVLEGWQRELVTLDPQPFLRGLFHSDGCRVVNWTVRRVGGEPKRYEYPRYFFTNRSADIRGLCTWGLDLLGVPWRAAGRWNISVARREGVAALDAFVGPKY